MKEEILYQVWLEDLSNRSLKTNSGEDIKILYPGEHEPDQPGPDFKNAKIKIGNIIFVGDVEIDLKQNDWWTHGHKNDPNYAAVILHVSVFDKKFNYLYNVYNRKIYTLDISSYLDEESFNLLKSKTNIQKQKKFIPCEGSVIIENKEQTVDYIRSLGISRFEKKSYRILERLKELAYNKKVSEPIIAYQYGEDFYSKEFTATDFMDKEIWEQAFYEFLFEALGYTLNKEIMLKLAQAVTLSYIKNAVLDLDKDIITKIEAAFFNISGLWDINNNNIVDDYEKKVCEIWHQLKLSYDGRTFDRNDWKFFRLRPQNFPTIRLAGGSRLVYEILFENLIKKIFEILRREQSLYEYIQLLQSLFIVKADGYWSEYYDCGKKASEKFKYFIGINRADEIIMNVVLPFAYIYADIFQKQEIKQKTIQIFSYYSIKENNSITNKLSEILQIKSDKAVIYQGLLELYRNWCCKRKCSQCAIWVANVKKQKDELKNS